MQDISIVSRRSVLKPRRARGGTRQKAAALREELVCMPHARHGHPGPAGEPVYDVRRTDPRGRYTGRTDVSGEPHGTGSARRSSGAVEEGERVRGEPARGADGPARGGKDAHLQEEQQPQQQQQEPQGAAWDCGRSSQTSPTTSSLTTCSRMSSSQIREEAV